MIGKLSGRLDSVQGQQIILDVGGVGYLVTVSARTLAALTPGQAAALWIETHLREDALLLYGFLDVAARDAFRLLTTVQGVGAKSALSILGLFSPDELAAALVAGDKTALSRADGVGPKLALRLVTELKDKAALIGGSALMIPAKTQASGPAGSTTGAAQMAEDAVSALIHLGYRRMDAFAAVTAARSALGADAGLDAVIRDALSRLARQMLDGGT